MTTASEDPLKRITARPDVFNGKPIIRDMRISVELVLSLLSQGASHEELKETTTRTSKRKTSVPASPMPTSS